MATRLEASQRDGNLGAFLCVTNFFAVQMFQAVVLARKWAQ